MLNLDTHILLFALSDQLSSKERKLLSKDDWSISGIVLWEIAKLRQLGRIHLAVSDLDFSLAIANIHVWPIDFQVFKALRQLDYQNDPADEIIGATSLAFGAPLVTRDQKLIKSKVVPLAL